VDGRACAAQLDFKQSRQDRHDLVKPAICMIPYATQTIEDADLAAVREVLTSGWLTQGPAVPRFEAAFASAHGVAHAVAVSSATAGLHIACLALGVGPGQYVWTSPNSFVASANCALYCGADVDFVDIDPQTRNMSTEALNLKLEYAQRTGKLPALVIPVHFAGLPCDMASIRELADRYGFRILEDASHAVGASYAGQPVGSRYADASVFSFHPVKIITSGEGGMVTTQAPALARRLQLLRSHGITREAQEMLHPQANEGAWYYEQQVLGFNYRLTDLQAALGYAQLQRLEQFHAARERLAQRYGALLAEFPLCLPARELSSTTQARSSWHLYAVEVLEGARQRALVFASLREAGIAANVHYMPLHLQPYYRKLGFKPGYCPAAEAYGERALSIPLYPNLTAEQQDHVVASLAKALCV
jgi:UDP-4-amino-4,6-dideoxy-N-acetyl-beta-L-altrosamine transaminase